MPDADLWRKAPFALLVAALLLFGCWPRLLTDKIKPSAEPIVSMATTIASVPAKVVTADTRAIPTP